MTPYNQSPRIATFISIPRNASTTVRHILRLGPNRDEDRTRSVVVHENHQRAAVLAAKYNIHQTLTFCFVRHPYDRCVSWYEYHREQGKEPYTVLTFEQWVDEGLPHHWQVQNQTDYRALRVTPLLQTTFIEGCTVDWLGRVENFEADMATLVQVLNQICERRALDQRFRYVPNRSNVSDRDRDLSHYYSPRTKKLVRSLLEDDFRRFGYDSR